MKTPLILIEIDIDDQDPGWIDVIEAGGDPVCTTGRSLKERRNIEAVVNAVNAHANLLAACKAAREALEWLYLGPVDEMEPPDIEEAIEEVRAAIALAEPDTTKAVAS